MNVGYYKLSDSERMIAFLIYKKDKMTKEDIEKRFGEEKARKCLDELEKTSFIIYDPKTKKYQPSKYLEMALGNLRKNIF